MSEYRIDIQPAARFVVGTVSGDFPGAEEARASWQSVVDVARAKGLRSIMFVRYCGRPPDAVGLVETLRGFESLGLSGWRIAVVFWDAERMVQEYQFVTALASKLHIDLSVHDTVAGARAFLEAPAEPSSALANAVAGSRDKSRPLAGDSHSRIDWVSRRRH